MAKADSKKIHVYADWTGLPGPEPVGVLTVRFVRGKEIFSFEYDHNWLRKPDCHSLDPALGLYSGPHYPAEGDNFAVFMDSAPDRWGRFLMDRREALRARQEGRKPERLFESDYLLGVFDDNRMGALRFSLSKDGPFLDNDSTFATPPWSSLRELEQASLALEDKEAEPDDCARWLNMLIAPGSSLGGARPKSSVLDENRQLWIAKFPSRNDRIDAGLWEKLVHELAAESGLQVAPARLGRFADSYHTFLTQRFDRNSSGRRLHFASALTLLARKDGDDFSNGASYLELAHFLQTSGAKPAEDLPQLWRRIVFFIFVSNTDDHLRNHGFLLERKGWRLAPAYDMNPIPLSEGLALNISETDNSRSIELAREVAPYFRVSTSDAENTVRQIKQVVGHWRAKASGLGIPRAEQEEMDSAFSLAE